jgi:hypothetical protein
MRAATSAASDLQMTTPLLMIVVLLPDDPLLLH